MINFQFDSRDLRAHLLVASKHDQRQALKCVNFEIREAETYISSTNGHVILVSHHPRDKDARYTGSCSLTIPRDAIEAALKGVDKTDSIALVWDGAFHLSNERTSTRFEHVDGFPSIRRVIARSVNTDDEQLHDIGDEEEIGALNPDYVKLIDKAMVTASGLGSRGMITSRIEFDGLPGQIARVSNENSPNYFAVIMPYRAMTYSEPEFLADYLEQLND